MGENKNKLEIIGLALSFITPLIVLSMSYLLINRFEVQNVTSDTLLKAIQTEIAKIDLENKLIKKAFDEKTSEVKFHDINAIKEIHELQESILRIDLKMKEYKDNLEIANSVTINYLNSLEASVKKIRDKLDIKSRNLTITTETMKIINDLVPKLVLHFNKQETIFDYQNKEVKLFFELTNMGKYGCNIDDSIIVVTEGIKDTDGDFIKIKELSTPNDYSVGIESRTGYYPSEETHPSVYTLTFNNWANGIWPKDNRIQFKITIKYHTQQVVVDSIKEHIKDVISNEKLNNLIKSEASYSVNLGLMGR